MAVELATAYVSIVPDTSRVRQDLERAFGAAGASAGASAGEAAGGGIGDKLKSMGGKGGPIMAAVGAVGLAAGALLMSSITSGMEREKAADLTQARLGVDDATMKKIGTAAANAYTSTFGESVEANMDTARRAIQAGLLNPDATAKETQEVIQQLSGISDLMGEEIPAVARAAGQAIKTGLAGDATDAMDLFAAAERNGLNVSEDFLDTITEYGTQFRKLGLDGPEAVGLINQAVKNGARDVDIAADAWKEFSIRVMDGSTSTSEAFETLGFNAEDLAARFAEGGTVARAATGDLLAEINKIEDPVKKNEIALALFGTQAEDLGAALNSFNLDTAVASLGQVEGAAQSAANTLGGNTASTIEGAKRSIEVSMQGVQNSIAQAFGPTLEKVATWVNTHQPEITGFFIAVGDAAFALGDVMLLWASTTSSNLAHVLRSFGSTLEGILDPIGTAAVAIGNLTGKQGLVDFGNTLKSVQDNMNGAADGLDSFANMIDSKGRPALANMRDGFNATATEAKNAQLMTRALGAEVELIPSDKDILITSNTPEQQAQLAALGLRLEELDDQPGVFKVVSNTAEGQKIIDSFVATNTGKTIPTTVTADTTQAQQAVNAFVTRNTNTNAVNVGVNAQLLGIPTPNANGSITSYANGKLPGQALIQPGRGSGLFQWAEGETGGEAFIPMATSKRDRSMAIWEEVGRRFGVITMADGGIAPGKAFAQSMDPAVYEMGGFSTSSIDCSGMVSAVINDAMGLNPFSDRMGTATASSWLTARGAKSGLGGPGDIAVGWFDNGTGPYGGHMAMTLGDGTNVESNGSEGVVIGGPVGAGDAMFTNQMHIPAAMLRGGDLGGSAGGANTGGLGGSGTGGSGGGSGGSGLGGSATGGGAGTYASSVIPAGVTPVWVVGTGTGATTPTTSDGTDTMATTDSYAPTTAAGAGDSSVQTVDEVLASAPGKFQAAGQSFIDSNIDEFLGTIGARRSGGVIQALGSQIFDAITSAIQADIAARAKQSKTFA